MSGIVAAGRAAPENLKARLIALRGQVIALCKLPRTEDSLEEASWLLDELASVTANAGGQLSAEQIEVLSTLTAKVDDFIRR